jgi:hypothetical protein
MEIFDRDTPNPDERNAADSSNPITTSSGSALLEMLRLSLERKA